MWFERFLIQIPLGMRGVPGPGGADDVLQTGVFRAPAEVATGLLGGGDEARRVAGPARLFGDGNFLACDLFAGLNDFAHGITAAIAEVVKAYRAWRERADVRVRQ